MAEISAKLVKELREMTGAGMMECKKALVEADGDMEKAVDVLRTRGLAAAEKKAGRATNEGTVATYVSSCGKRAGIVEVQCETDFVGTNKTFVEFAQTLATIAAKANPADVESFKGLEVAQYTDGEADGTVNDMLTDKIHTIGENMNLARVETMYVDGEGAISSYIHMGGKIGVLVKFTFEKEATKDAESFKTLAKDVAMQVAATSPLAASRDNVAQSVIDHEMDIYKAQAAQSGKPENIQEKMAQGRLEKFFKQFVLTEQEFIKDPDLTVAKLLEKVSKELDDTITIDSFIRMGLGEEA